MAHPRFYWSEFNQGYMRKPHVEKHLLYDVYIAPEEHYAPGDNPKDKFANTLELLKGETKKYDDVEYTFEGFEIGGHGEGEAHENMRVTARVTAKPYGGQPENLTPYLELTADNQRVNGKITMANGAVMELAGIQADAGAILLSFEKPGVQAQQASLLVLEVSRKPLVGLVWVGSILVLLGALMALIFRSRSELPIPEFIGGLPKAERSRRHREEVLSE
jgi:hypothetical protein